MPHGKVGSTDHVVPLLFASVTIIGVPSDDHSLQGLQRRVYDRLMQFLASWLRTHSDLCEHL
jgi:hypothetical protein